LQQAQLIFWVGPELEAFLEKPLEALGQNATQISLLRANGVSTLPARVGNGFDPDLDEGEVHVAGEKDAHIWLDPENAKAMVKAIAEALSKADPTNAKAYAANAGQLISKLDGLSSEIAATVAPAKGQGFIVFHDAYHYFENRFKIKASGAISINPENPPGAGGIATLRQRIVDGKIKCVFSEPQFDNKLVNILIEGTKVKYAVLDPEGATLDPGPALYESVLRNISVNLSSCLTEP
jgi:zinc transport system substrate-binding protein